MDRQRLFNNIVCETTSMAALRESRGILGIGSTIQGLVVYTTI